MLLLHQGNIEAFRSKTQQGKLDSRTERVKKDVTPTKSMFLLLKGNIGALRTEQARLDSTT